jgi:hypothetical protein
VEIQSTKCVVTLKNEIVAGGKRNATLSGGMGHDMAVRDGASNDGMATWWSGGMATWWSGGRVSGAILNDAREILSDGRQMDVTGTWNGVIFRRTTELCMKGPECPTRMTPFR